MEEGMEADLGSRIQESRMEGQEVISGYKTTKPTSSGHSFSTKVQPPNVTTPSSPTGDQVTKDTST